MIFAGMMNLLATVAWLYASTVGAAFAATVGLIFAGTGWGQLPHKYLDVVTRIQEIFEDIQATAAIEQGVGWLGPVDSETDLVERSQARCVLARSTSAVHADNMQFQFDVDKENLLSVIDMSVDLASAGLQSIVQDKVSTIFSVSPAYVYYELTLPVWREITGRFWLKTLFVASIVFRVGFLFPLRLLLLLSSFAHASFWCIVALFVDLSAVRKTWIAVVYCRLFCAGTGLVARYHNPTNKPKRPGIAVSNHLSPNDIQVICADVEPEREYLYAVTGQRHAGIIWVIERLVERLCHSLWFDRATPADRKRFMGELLSVARTAGPVLLFPEGYCTNNTGVLQFRRAVFTDNVTIYPIAIRQKARFGDSFWHEDQFHSYLFRLLTSWATVYDIYYLEPQQKQHNETSDMFANRVQKLIADAIGARPADFDGAVWYKDVEKTKFRNALREKCARQMRTIVPPDIGLIRNSVHRIEPVKFLM